ncbi:MAG TPA: cyclase family protein [Limnochordales bacterium]
MAGAQEAVTAGQSSRHIIEYRRVVHLSHILRPGMPCWPGDPPMAVEPAAELDRDGFCLQRLSLGEHTGTHVNAPSHLLAGGSTVDQVPAAALVLPAVVLDCRREAAADCDFTLEPSHIERFEARWGPIPAGSAVLLCTGWAARWHDPAAYLNPGADGRMHFPGFGLAAVRFLLEERRAAALGIDTHGIDPGCDETYAANKLALGRGALVLENVANLDQLLPVGTTLVVGLLRIAGGSGAPAAVLALVP